MTLVKRENVFPSIWNDLFNDSFFKNTNLNEASITMPAVNIKENPENYIIELAAPGKKKEDFKIQLDHNLLTISSEDKNETTEENKEDNYTRREYYYKSFSRSFTLPDAADGENISANYKDGVLNVIISKKEEAKVNPTRLIEIS
jgi:HSP20 family protein